MIHTKHVKNTDDNVSRQDQVTDQEFEIIGADGVVDVIDIIDLDPENDTDAETDSPVMESSALNKKHTSDANDYGREDGNGSVPEESEIPDKEDDDTILDAVFVEHTDWDPEMWQSHSETVLTDMLWKNGNRFSFEIEGKIPGQLGRAGIIHTPHGDIKTPAFMCVGTHGHVKFISMEDLHEMSAQAMLSNGYHLRKTSPEIAAAGGLAEWSGWHGPTLTDSGGFQVMSLGSGIGKVVSMEREKEIKNAPRKDRMAIVTEDGIEFTDPFTGEWDFIGPTESMEIQCRIGADIHMAFDELTSLADDYDYNVEALERTERWAQKSLDVHQQHAYDLGYYQALYGVLQGGRWEDLRRSTAKKLGSMDFDGYGLGGAFLKEDLGKILRWCNEELPENKPRHLLGLSRPDDILFGIENGADTFDCVAPSREARHGRIYTADGYYPIHKFANSDLPLEEGCDCATCQAGWTRGQLRDLKKSEDPKDREKYFNLATIHNLRFIIRLTEEARQAIMDGNFEEFKNTFFARYYKPTKDRTGWVFHNEKSPKAAQEAKNMAETKPESQADEEAVAGSESIHSEQIQPEQKQNSVNGDSESASHSQETTGPAETEQKQFNQDTGGSAETEQTHLEQETGDSAEEK